MEENIKRVEHLIERCNQCKMHECIECEICWSEVQAIENLLKGYKELKEENAILKKANNISATIKVEDITQVMNKSLEEFNKEFIPISVIQEKIDELDNMINEISKGNLQRYTVGEIIYFKKILKDILEEERNK